MALLIDPDFLRAEPRDGDEAVEVSDRKWWLLGGNQNGTGSTWFLRYEVADRQEKKITLFSPIQH